MAKAGKGKNKPTVTRADREAAARRARPVPAPPPAARVARPAPRPAAPPLPNTVGTRYLDIGVVRIQQWISRTPDLAFRRGASSLLSEATGNAEISPLLPAGVALNPEAGELDGVVSLVITGSPDQADELAARAATVVASHLRQRMPHCAIEAVDDVGASYLQAYQNMSVRRDRGELLLQSWPPPPEVVVGKPCDQCRAAAVTDNPVRHHRELLALCPDCLARRRAAGSNQADIDELGPAAGEWTAPRPSIRALHAVNARSASQGLSRRVERFVETFEALARFEDRDGTQLATLYADGNAVGTFLSLAAERAGRAGWPAKSQIVPALDAATLGALAEAALGLPGTDAMPLLVHVAGGDDLLLSIPASRGWAFARTLVAQFPLILAGELAAAQVGRARVAEGDLPTLSVGLVFHHNSEPFADVVRSAEHELRLAKQATVGKAASISFLDLTADGYTHPAARAGIRADRLHASGSLYDAVAAVPAAQRATFLQLLREEQDSRLPRPTMVGAHIRQVPVGGGPAETALQALTRRLPQLDAGVLGHILTGTPKPDPGRLREALTSAEGLSALREALDIARWWPEPRTGATP